MRFSGQINPLTKQAKCRAVAAVIYSLCVLLSPRPSLAANEACPDIWRDDVSIVGELISNKDLKGLTVVFADPEGNAFDCLGAGVSAYELQRISYVNKLYWQAPSDLPDGATLADEVCGYSVTNLPASVRHLTDDSHCWFGVR
ncbi:MAG: hypothetical protein GC186_16440 [Rhodobacteraceae bacterium]|nr:hypothetical protein [Paracoccaceae bacterium]